MSAQLLELTSFKSVPFVSIIMPVYNEGEFILRSLTALAAQNYDCSKMEIIVADGLSTDDTRAVVNSFARTSPVKITIVENEGRTAPTGLNRAISAAQGEIVIRVDGHCEIDPDYVPNCVRKLQDGNADAVGGPIETIGETNKAKAIAAAMSSKFGVGGSAFRTVKDKELFVDTVAFPGYKRDTLMKTGSFNEELVRNQDDEYNYRLRKSGGRILLCPEIRSRYYSRSTFRSLLRQYYQYGYWKVRVFQIHPAQMSLRQFVPLLFILTISGLAVASFLSSFAQIFLAAVILVYLIFAFLAAIGAARPLGSMSVPLVLFSFLILHVSYGSGFLVGLFAFRGRWGGNITHERSAN